MSRSKNWELIAYPENCDKELLLEKLSDLQINYYLSPLHNMDVYTKLDVEQKKVDADKIGYPKKEHWHLILCFASMKSFAQVVEISKELNCSAFVKEVHSLVGALRYLCHLDEKNKYIYSENDVVCRFNDYAQRIEVGTNNFNFVGQLVADLSMNRINEFYDLIAFYSATDNKKMLNFCQKNSYFSVSVVKSKKYSKENVDKEIKKRYNNTCKPSGGAQASSKSLQEDFPSPSVTESLALEAGNEDKLPF